MLPRAAAFALSLTLATPMLAPAQSLAGWVLWKRVKEGRIAPVVLGEAKWEPEIAFERLNDCRLSAVAKAKSYPAVYELINKELRAAKEPESTDRVFVEASDSTEPIVVVTSAATRTVSNIAFLCFPGTLDPRPLAIR